jgi:small subunit ribosomal protein S16
LSVRIRLKRAGSTHKPFYKVIVADSRSPRDGRAIEEIGFYDPLKKPEIVKIDDERYSHWLSVGASASEVVDTLFKRMKKREAGIEVPGDAPAAETPIAEAAAAEAAETEAAPEEKAAPEAEAKPAEEPASEEAPAKNVEKAAPEGESDKQ